MLFRAEEMTNVYFNRFVFLPHTGPLSVCQMIGVDLVTSLPGELKEKAGPRLLQWAQLLLCSNSGSAWHCFVAGLVLGCRDGES